MNDLPGQGKKLENREKFFKTLGVFMIGLTIGLLICYILGI